MRKSVLILGHNAATQFIDIFNQYTRLFDPQKHEVTVAYLTGPEEAETRQRTIAENVLFLDIPKKSIRGLKINAINKLLKLCKQKKFEIVICHRYKPTYIMLWVAQFYKIPSLFFVMHELHTCKALPRKLLIAALFRPNMQFAGVSNAVRDDIKHSLWRVPKKNIITLYNMIDFDLTEPYFLNREDARRELHIPNDIILFGNIARLVPNKDQHTLIHAFSLIKPYCPNAKLMLIGDGALEAQLKQQAKNAGLQDDIIFTGYLPSAFRYMKAFDCFVLSSIQEAFGRVLLEAFVAKIPVIASSVNGIPEVVGETGKLIKAKDATQFSIAMKEIYFLLPEEREKLAEKAYERALKDFSIPAFQKIFWQNPIIETLKD